MATIYTANYDEDCKCIKLPGLMSSVILFEAQSAFGGPQKYRVYPVDAELYNAYDTPMESITQNELATILEQAIKKTLDDVAYSRSLQIPARVQYDRQSLTEVERVKAFICSLNMQE